MYFFAIWTHFDQMHIQVLKTPFSRKEWTKRISETANFPEDAEAWRFHYNDNEFLDSCDWHISPTLYLSEKLARDAAKIAHHKSQERWRRFNIRDASKRKRIQNKTS